MKSTIMTNRTLFFLSRTTALILFFLFSLAAQSTAQPANGVVSRIIDGDTFTLSTGETIRLAGIDSPETSHPVKRVEWFGPQAKAHLEELIGGKSIRLEYDAQIFDKYDRLLAFVFVDDSVFVNRKMIQNGYATAFLRFECKYQWDFLEEEVKARIAAVGMWASPSQSVSQPNAAEAGAAPARDSQVQSVSPISPKVSNDVQYWINSKSGARHNSSCRWYGATKRGYYTTEKKGHPCGICGG